jgi:hypothetical protein
MAGALRTVAASEDVMIGFGGQAIPRLIALHGRPRVSIDRRQVVRVGLGVRVRWEILVENFLRFLCCISSCVKGHCEGW